MEISGPLASFFVKKVNWRLFGLFAFVIISVLVYVSFFFFGENILPGEGARTARNFIVETSKLFISAVVAGVVLKILVLERYFTDALSEVIHGMRGLKEMSPQRRIELWQTLTSWIYAPILHEGTALSPELQALSQRMTKVIGRTFEYHKNFYLSHSDRQLEFEWTSEKHRRLRMIDFMNVIFESSAVIPWQTERMSEKHLTFDPPPLNWSILRYVF